MTGKIITRRTALKGLGVIAAAPVVFRLQIGRLYAQDIGAAADGSLDALAIINDLLARARDRGRGTVILPAGRFLLIPKDRGGAIAIPANVRLEGAGIDKTTLVMANRAGGHVISCPFGHVEIADLTIDGNAANRVGAVGHNLRLQGDMCVVERVRSIHSVSYGIAIGQKSYARNITIRDVEIVDAGNDGIDVKNTLGRTENILIERVMVRGFGRVKADVPADKVGTRLDPRIQRAGVDLRGANCEVRGLTILGVLKNRDGLRFRSGEANTPNGAGAHGARAVGVIIKGIAGQPQGRGIQVAARDVVLEDFEVEDMNVGLSVSAPKLTLKKGRFSRSTAKAISTYRSRREGVPKPDSIRFEDVNFVRESHLDLRDIQSASFERCAFSGCSSNLKASLQADAKVTLEACTFDASCKN